MSDTNGRTPTINADQSRLSLGGLRGAIAKWLGQSGYQDRDHYDTFDWPKDPSAEQFYALYTRNPFAKPVVDRPAFTSWRDTPELVDDGRDTETQFEQDLARAERQLDLWSYTERLDRLAGIGRFGVLVWITSDVDAPADLATELTDTGADGLDGISQIKVFSEASVEDVEWGTIEDADAGRWGKPVAYEIDFSPEATADGDDDDTTYKVHHSRTTAAPASRLLDDDFFGRPRLEVAINALRDIEKTMGAVAEMAYRGAEKGIAIEYDPEDLNTNLDADLMEKEEEELQDWHHTLQWFFRTSGSVRELGGNIADVRKLLDPELSALASATGIPKRVFEGDPAGALASAEEDTQAYFGMISERRTEYNTPHYVRPVLGWLVEHGVASPPATDGGVFGVDATWPSLRVLSEGEKAERTQLVTEAIGEAITVGEGREMAGLPPNPDVPGLNADMLLSEVSGGGGGPGEALDAALSENRRKAGVSARNEARIQRGQNAEADDD